MEESGHRGRAHSWRGCPTSTPRWTSGSPPPAGGWPSRPPTPSRQRRWGAHVALRRTSRPTFSRPRSPSTSATPSARRSCCRSATPGSSSCPVPAAPCRRSSRTPARTTTPRSPRWRRWCWWGAPTGRTPSGVAAAAGAGPAAGDGGAHPPRRQPSTRRPRCSVGRPRPSHQAGRGRRPACGSDRPVVAEQLVVVAAPRAGSARRSRRRREASTQRHVVHEAADGRCERGAVAGGVEQAVALVVDDVDGPSGSRGPPPERPREGLLADWQNVS